MTDTVMNDYSVRVSKMNMLKEYTVIGLKYYSRNPIAWLFSIIMPILFITMFSSVNSNNKDHRPTIAIVNNDKLQDASFNKLKYRILHFNSTRDIKNAVKRGKADFAVIRDEAGRLEVFHTQFSYLNAAEFILQTEHETYGKADKYKQIQIERDNTQYEFLASIFILSIIQLAMYSTATRVMQDKNTGLHSLFTTRKNAAFYMLFGELVSKILIIALQSVLLLVICLYLFPITATSESIAAYFTVMLFGGAVLVTLGYAIGMALAPLKNGVHFVTVINLVLLFFGNVMFPSSTFTYTKFIAKILPTTPLVELMGHGLFLKDYSSSIYTNVASLIAWMFIGLAMIGLMENYTRNRK